MSISYIYKYTTEFTFSTPRTFLCIDKIRQLPFFKGQAETDGKLVDPKEVPSLIYLTTEAVVSVPSLIADSMVNLARNIREYHATNRMMELKSHLGDFVEEIQI